jgi:hypothetical protein
MNSEGIVLVETLTVDGVQTVIPEEPGALGCDGEVVWSSMLPPGRYIVGMTGGPGISWHTPGGDYEYEIAFYGKGYKESYLEFGGLSGLAKVGDTESFYVFVNQGPGDCKIGFFIVDSYGYDNGGYVEVGIGTF